MKHAGLQKGVAILGLLACLGSTAWGQTISVNADQRAKLVSLVNSDPEAKGFFAEIQRGADRGLNDTPNPTSRILTEGKLEGNADKTRTQESLGDMKKVADLAWAYAVTSDKKYAAKAMMFATAWADKDRSKGDPIDDTNLDKMIVAYDLVGSTASDADRKKVDEWLRGVAQVEIKGGTHGYNNWNSHRIKIVGMIAFVLKDKELIKTTTDEYQKQIEHNLKADGASTDFYERDALHYHLYDVEPLLEVAIAAKMNGVDLYRYKDSALAKGVAFVDPFALGQKTHAEFVHSKVGFDKQRAANGQAEYKAGHLFEPKSATGMYELDAFFDKDHAYKILQGMGVRFEKFPSWDTVVEEAERS